MHLQFVAELSDAVHKNDVLLRVFQAIKEGLNRLAAPRGCRQFWRSVKVVYRSLCAPACVLATTGAARQSIAASTALDDHA